MKSKTKTSPSTNFLHNLIGIDDEKLEAAKAASKAFKESDEASKARQAGKDKASAFGALKEGCNTTNAGELARAFLARKDEADEAAKAAKDAKERAMGETAINTLKAARVCRSFEKLAAELGGKLAEQATTTTATTTTSPESVK